MCRPYRFVCRGCRKRGQPVRICCPDMRRALITGITGQDGSYLAEYLTAQGYEVWGLVRGQQNPRVRQLRQLLPEVRLVRGDLLDQGSLISAVERVQPDEVYNLAAISYVPMSWQQAELTGEVTGLGVLRVLEAIRVCSGISASRSPGRGQIRFYQASSSEMFGLVRESPQTEQTPFHPRSPYGVAKSYGHFLTQNYRESYGMFAVSGILFNHLARRGEGQTRLRAAAAAWEPVGPPGLGLRRRLCPRDTPDARPGRARRFRDRHGCYPLGRGSARASVQGSRARLA
jgi:GDP-mannose 4,6-dehydratase